MIARMRIKSNAPAIESPSHVELCVRTEFGKSDPNLRIADPNLLQGITRRQIEPSLAGANLPASGISCKHYDIIGSIRISPDSRRSRSEQFARSASRDQSLRIGVIAALLSRGITANLWT